MSEKRNARTQALAAVMSLCSTLAFPRMMQLSYDDRAISGSIVCLLYFVGVYALLEKELPHLNRRMCFCTAPLAVFFSMQIKIGRGIAVHGEVDFSLAGLVKILFEALLFAPALFGCLVALFRRVPRDKGALQCAGTGGGWFRWRPFLVTLGALLLLWTPVFLAYYPAIWSYDVAGETAQIYMAQGFSMNHPPLHTLLVSGCLALSKLVTGGWQFGAALYAGLQMLLLSGAFAYACTFCTERLRVGKCGAVLLALFYGLMPFHAMLAVSVTKDVLYTACLCVLLVFLAEAALDGKAAFLRNRKLVALGAVSMLACLLRNNAGLPLGVMLLAALALSPRRWKLCCAVLSGVLLALALNATFQKATGATQIKKKEALAVPVQAIGRTVALHGDTLTAEERAAVDACFKAEVSERYNPILTDDTQATLQPLTTDAEVRRLLRCYFLLMPGHMNDYMNALACTTAGYWNPDDQSIVATYQTRNAKGHGYLITETKATTPAVVADSKLPRLRALYEKLFVDGDGYLSVPLLPTFLSPATYAWLVLTAAAAFLYQRRYGLLVPLGLLLGSFLNCLLGPCVTVRYAYPIMAAAPVMLACIGVSSRYRSIS